MNSNTDPIISSMTPKVQRRLGYIGVFTTEQLVQKTEIDLLSISSFGYSSLDNVVKTLKKHGLKLRFDPNQPTGYIPHRPNKVRAVKRAVKNLFLAGR